MYFLIISRKNPVGGLPKQTLEADFSILSQEAPGTNPLSFASYNETEILKISIEVIEEIMKNKSSSIVIRV